MTVRVKKEDENIQIVPNNKCRDTVCWCHRIVNSKMSSEKKDMPLLCLSVNTARDYIVLRDVSRFGFLRWFLMSCKQRCFEPSIFSTTTERHGKEAKRDVSFKLRQVMNDSLRRQLSSWLLLLQWLTFLRDKSSQTACLSCVTKKSQKSVLQTRLPFQKREVTDSFLTHFLNLIESWDDDESTSSLTVDEEKGHHLHLPLSKLDHWFIIIIVKSWKLLLSKREWNVGIIRLKSKESEQLNQQNKKKWDERLPFIQDSCDSRVCSLYSS